MFWRNKIKAASIGSLSDLEQNIIHYVIGHVPSRYSSILKQQLLFLKRIRRLDYPSFQVAELFPESFDSIPNISLLPRQEEFRLAVVKIKINDISYTSEIFCVLGAIFEIKIRPKFNPAIPSSAPTFINLRLEENLEKNTVI